MLFERDVNKLGVIGLYKNTKGPTAYCVVAVGWTSIIISSLQEVNPAIGLYCFHCLAYHHYRTKMKVTRYGTFRCGRWELTSSLDSA
jgi:hypothetical protein